ncbi:hypothetical protein [Paraburkholderia sp. SUR17]|uniref:hypothetical protein n=1 Tax=Paraburkholderia sp. SUR17 TaxID=3034358 RepID=UPI0024081541|nr:hypothetical protein [Paraburkholderia sp. SUR17]WEY39268.1 hypothetical protein P2869_02485 [Paraburkholderia sp. SUR17]
MDDALATTRWPPIDDRRATWRLAGTFIAHRKFFPLARARPGRLKPYLGGFSPTSPSLDPASSRNDSLRDAIRQHRGAIGQPYMASEARAYDVPQSMQEAAQWRAHKPCSLSP